MGDDGKHRGSIVEVFRLLSKRPEDVGEDGVVHKMEEINCVSGLLGKSYLCSRIVFFEVSQFSTIWLRMRVVIYYPNLGCGYILFGWKYHVSVRIAVS